MCSSELELQSLHFRRAFNHICICYLHLFQQLFLALALARESMCFSAGFLSFAVLICTWKIVKYNSPFLPSSLALHPPIIQLGLSWMTTSTIRKWNEYNVSCLHLNVQSLTFFPFMCRQVYFLLYVCSCCYSCSCIEGDISCTDPLFTHIFPSIVKYMYRLALGHVSWVQMS